MCFICKNSSNHVSVADFLLKQVYLLNIWFWLKGCIFHPMLEINVSALLNDLPAAPLSFVTYMWKVSVIVNLCHTVTFVFPMGLKCVSARKHIMFPLLTYSLRPASCFVHNCNICWVNLMLEDMNSYFYIHCIKYVLEHLLIAKSWAELWTCSGEQPEKALNHRAFSLVGHTGSK